MTNYTKTKRKEYLEKFKDPRWQKTRLKILTRDGWACQICEDGDSTLHVHHRYYLPNKEPWEYPEDAFITLCETCHENETENRHTEENALLFALKGKFLSPDVHDIAMAFREMLLLHASEVVATVIKWALTTPEIQQELIDRFLSDSYVKQRDNKTITKV